MKTADDILSQMRRLEVVTSASTREPIQLSGWYENTDGSVSKIAWVNDRPRVRVTVHSWAATETWDALQMEGARLFG